MRLILTILLTAATCYSAETYIIATGENGTDEAYVADRMVYTNWLNDAVVWLPFPAEKLAGTYYDYSIQGNDGTQTTAGFRPTWTNGYYEFDGADDYINVPTNDTLTLEVGTVAMWLRLDSLAAGKQCFGVADTGSSVNYINFQVSSDGSVFAACRQNIYCWRISTSTTPITAATWSHVALVQDGNASTRPIIYVDGVAQALDAAAVTENDKAGWFADVPSADNVTVGALIRSTSAVWLDGLDDARIYDRALTAPELLAMYNAEPLIANGGKR